VGPAPVTSAGAREAHGTRVRVPASTSNLGAGFDSIGLALARFLTADYTPAAGGSGLHIERRGTLRALDDHPDTHDLFLRVFRRTLDIIGAPAPDGTLIVDSEIPIGRGLGSSAAAVTAAIALAARSCNAEISTEWVLRLAQEHEHHLDNVAPALLGGLVAVARDANDLPHPFHLPLSEHVGFAFAAPGLELETRQARAALPERVSLRDAVHNVGAMAALTRALATGDRALLDLGFTDRLHVRVRVALIPGAEAAITSARAAGAWGATVSGAGSGLIAVGDPNRMSDIADAMAAAFRRVTGPHGVIGFAVDPAPHGLTHD
jgi:homoserine kinase